MDHFKIIKRAWNITWSYKVLWAFGFLLALTTGGMSGGGGSGSGYRMDESDVSQWFPHGEFNLPGFSQAFQDIFGALISLVIVFACLGVIFAVVFTIIRYVSETALFRMVDQHEIDETKYTLKEGFRLGWSKNAFNLFLMDLIIALSGFIVFALLLLIAAIPLLSWLIENDAIRIIGTITSAGLGLLVLFVAILTGIVVSLILQFARRACVLGNRGVIEAIQAGFELVRSHLSDSIIMGLILFGTGIAFAILMIPIVLLLVFLAALFGGLPGLLAYWLASLAFEGTAPYIIGFLVAFPLFLLIVIIPSALIGGVYETFVSSAWTLTYREFLSLKSNDEEKPEPPENLLVSEASELTQNNFEESSEKDNTVFETQESEPDQEDDEFTQG